MRAGAAVLGYNDKGELVTLRKGDNDLICLASDPKAKAFSVACYQKISGALLQVIENKPSMRVFLRIFGLSR